MKRHHTTIVLSLISGLILFFTVSALSNWNETLVKRDELHESYLSGEEIDRRYCGKSEVKVLEERIGTLANIQHSMDRKLDSILIHWRVKGGESKAETCPYPPCPKEETRTARRGGSDGG